MKAAITLLVLLFSVSGAQTRSTQTEVQPESQSTEAAAAAAAPAAAAADVSTTQLDIYAELKELRDMVVEQRVLLKSTQDELKEMEAENAAVRERLVASETKVEALETLTLAQEARISAGEDEVEKLTMVTAAQDAELAALKTRLAATETDIANVEEKITDTPKVAFSAGLTSSGHIQAGNTHMNLVFSRIITNVGQAYSSVSGIFTAPVRGVYYFRYNAMDVERKGWTSIRMLKNGKQVMYNSRYDDNGQRIHNSNGLTLQLEVGDTVNLQLHANDRVFDDGQNSTNFSGFLLFSL